ncbi:MAG: alpha/beta fold hydrolase [Candidatus Promineifilaceae bacterium]|nr:alpha/beta fold hydrolase [Candidatus Promineifilaceae bacterium]
MQIDLELYREEVEVEPGVTLSLVDVAPEQPAQTLVLVHGFGGNATQWQYQVQAFAERNRVLAPDLRGHGRSSAPRNGYDMPRLLADLRAVLDSAEVDGPVVLAGHSFGGAIVTDFALQYPEMVSRLILIAAAREYRLFSLYRLAFHLPDPVIGTLQPVVRRFVPVSALSLKRMFWESLRAWQGDEKFPRLQMPTMVIRGERDRVFPEAAFAEVSERVPGEDDVNVGASAHMVMIERRDAVNRAIERFMDEEGAALTYSRWRSERARPGRNRLLMERPWLAHYESGVPHTLDIPRLPLTRFLDRAVRRFPHRPAVRFKGKTLTYRRLNREVGRMANALRSLGIEKGARVMILLPNNPQLVIAYYGVLRLGAVVVMGNPLAEPGEVVRQARESGAKVLVTLPRMQEVAVAMRAQSDVRQVIYARTRDYLPFYKKVLSFRRRPEDLLRRPPGDHELAWRTLLRGRDDEAPKVEVAPEDVAAIQYTGGTTARPQGVVLSHRNLVANVVQVRSWLPDARDGEEVVLCVVPFSHVYGMTVGLNLTVAMGASMVLLPRFGTKEVLEHVKKYRPSFFPGVPSMFMAINNFPGVRKYDVQSIRACLSGAAPLPIEVEEAFEKLTKGRLVEGYGLTEAGPVTHANPIYGREKIGSIGLPLPNTEAKIVDLRTGIPLEVPAGQFGELIVRGPQVMVGYWQDEEGTRDVLDADGWLRTGDVARMDEEGYFQIISRRQDMWQADEATPAFPRDVEEVIYELPEVREVVVVGIANRPVAFVQLKEGADVAAKSIMAYAKRRLPAGQAPRLVIFVKEFPRSFIGKVLRRELVSQYAQEIAAGAGSVGDHLPGLDGE